MNFLQWCLNKISDALTLAEAKYWELRGYRSTSITSYGWPKNTKKLQFIWDRPLVFGQEPFPPTQDFRAGTEPGGEVIEREAAQRTLDGDDGSGKMARKEKAMKAEDWKLVGNRAI